MGGDLGWLIGVALNITGSISINCGTNLMKLGHNRRARDIAQQHNASSTSIVRVPSKQKGSDIALARVLEASQDSVDSASSHNATPRGSVGSSERVMPDTAVGGSDGSEVEKTKTTAAAKPIFKYPVWVVGMGMFVIGNILNFASFGFAAQSLLSALGAIQFVSNVIFARWVLKERVTWLTLLATAIIVGACLLLVLFGSHVTMELTAQLAMELYRDPRYYGYLIGLAVVAPLLYAAYRAATWGEKHYAGNKDKARTVRLLVLARPLLYAAYAALIGTQSVLFGKTVSELIGATARGQNQFTEWFTYVAMLMLAITAVFWMYHLNKGLRLFPAVLIVPTMQIAWTLLSIVSGGLYYHEFASFTPLDFGMFALGVVLILVGVLLLTVTTAGPSAQVAPAARASTATTATTATAAAAVATMDTSVATLPDVVSMHTVHTVPSTPADANVTDEVVMVTPRRVRFEGPSKDDGSKDDGASVMVVLRRQTSRESLMRQLWRESSLLARQSLGLDDDDAALALNLMAMPVAPAAQAPIVIDEDAVSVSRQPENGNFDAASQV